MWTWLYWWCFTSMRTQQQTRAQNWQVPQIYSRDGGLFSLRAEQINWLQNIFWDDYDHECLIFWWILSISCSAIWGVMFFTVKLKCGAKGNHTFVKPLQNQTQSLHMATSNSLSQTLLKILNCSSLFNYQIKNHALKITKGEFCAWH